MVAMRERAWFWAAVVVGMLLVPGCATAQRQPRPSVLVSPHHLTLSIGQVAAVEASEVNQWGSRVETYWVWDSRNDRAAEVGVDDSQGSAVVSGMEPGESWIVARAAYGQRDSLLVTVNP